jgi:DNA-binding response OmpR family regulator
MRRKILLADDSPTIQRLVTQTFADANFEIVSVSNGDAAIRKFDEICPSVVLADIYMPGKNGFEVCSYVKSHSSLSSTPVVLLVGAFDAYNEESGKQVGASASITKPFEPHALVELVQSVDSRRESETETEPQTGTEPRPQPNVMHRPAPPVSLETPAVARAAHAAVAEDSVDLLGLESLFEPEASSTGADQISSRGISDEEIERIADRVIQRLSVEVIENIAWDVVPDITEKIVREELGKNR